MQRRVSQLIYDAIHKYDIDRKRDMYHEGIYNAVCVREILQNSTTLIRYIVLLGSTNIFIENENLQPKLL